VLTKLTLILLPSNYQLVQNLLALARVGVLVAKAPRLNQKVDVIANLPLPLASAPKAVSVSAKVSVLVRLLRASVPASAKVSVLARQKALQLQPQL